MEIGHSDACGCDGSLSSLIAIGLKVVLQKLLNRDMDIVIIMLTNMVQLMVLRTVFSFFKVIRKMLKCFKFLAFYLQSYTSLEFIFISMRLATTT